MSIIADLEGFDLGLIQVPYSLKPIEYNERFKSIYVFDRMKHASEYFIDWPKNLVPNLLSNRLKISEIHKKLRPQKGDTLFVFSEEELLNLMIIKKFKLEGNKIYLIEDGAAAYIFYSLESDPLSKRAKFFQYTIRLLYGLKGYYPFLSNGYVCQRISDSYYSGICYFLPIKILRNIPVYQIRKNAKLLENGSKKNAILLTQPIYSFYISFEEYLLNLKSIIEAIQCNFETLYIKFHPDEINSGTFIRIKEFLNKNGNVFFLESPSIIEEIISDLDISYAISYNSSALMNLLFYGIEPVYIYHLYSFLDDKITKQFTNYLRTLNYNFPKSLEEISPGYKSGLMKLTNNGISINKLLEKG